MNCTCKIENAVIGTTCVTCGKTITVLTIQAIEWDRKAKVLDEMSQDALAGDVSRLTTKAGVFRSVAVDLRRAIKDFDELGDQDTNEATRHRLGRN